MWSIQMWQNGRNGKTLSLEESSTRHQDYRLVILPENYHDDNQPIDVVGEYHEEDTARQEAEEYMREN